MNRYERLKQLLGIEAGNASALRTSATLVSASAAGLAANEQDALARVNASPYVKRALKSDEIYLHTIEAASNRFIPDRYAFIGENTLRNIASDAERGFAIITRHASGGMFSGDGENPYGRTFSGVVETNSGVTRTLVQFYMLRDHSPNGSASPSTDDLDKGIVGGTLFDVSIGLTRAGTGRYLCDVCHLELFSSCTHFPGTTEEMTSGEIDKQKSRGVPGGACTFTFDNFHAKEGSFVVDGAVEGAGTALANQSAIPAAPPRATEETMKYSNEVKLSLGLAVTASDAEVDQHLTTLRAAAAKSVTLEQQIKTAADTAFKAKVDGKLSAEEIAQIEKLDNRDALADMLITAKSKAAPAKPPMGNPLAGMSAAAAAPGADNLDEVTACADELREAAGVFATREEMDKYAATSPLEALKKFFNIGLPQTAPRTDGAVVSSLRADGEFIKRDKRTIDQRKHAFHIA